jgi:tetratricopeptide (TPR) repeat protein
MNGDMTRARVRMREAQEMAERFGAEFWVTVCYEFGGNLEMMAGDFEAAERAFRKLNEIHLRLGDEGHGSTGIAYHALALAHLGRFDEAEDLARAAQAMGAEDDRATQSSARSAEALVLSARGEHEEALRLAREAAEMYASAQSPWFYGDALMELAEVARAAGRGQEAADAAATALSEFERKEIMPAAASARAFLADLR